MRKALTPNDSFLGNIADHIPTLGVTKVLIALNLLVFFAMLFSGAGFWHSPNGVQLAWGANFAPATANGEWWRLATAMFLHFGALHLIMNMLALWDGGQLVERMYGHTRFFCIYVVSGLTGNLLSLVIQGNQAVSGGASGAIFGLYGSLLVYLWSARQRMNSTEFRWLFAGAIAFSVFTIAMGFLVKGIDNSAHIGGFVTGILFGMLLLPLQSPAENKRLLAWRSLSGLSWLVVIAYLLNHLPVPTYQWHEEIAIQQHIRAFAAIDQQATKEWNTIIKLNQEGKTTFADLATMIDQQVSAPYENSFETLSHLPEDPNLPSAKQLAEIKAYALKRIEDTKAASEKLRNIPFMPNKLNP